MKPLFLTRPGLILGFVAVLASVPALADGPSVACPPVKHHVVAHIRHHRVHRYVTRTVYREAWLPVCGSIDHPCNIEHIIVPREVE